MDVSLEQVMAMKLNGIGATKVIATVKKTIQRPQYEPEVIEMTVEQDYDRSFNGMEMALVQEITKLPLEYALHVKLYTLGVESKEDFSKRKEDMKSDILALINKLKTVCPDSTLIKEIESNMEELMKDLNN